MVESDAGSRPAPSPPAAMAAVLRLLAWLWVGMCLPAAAETPLPAEVPPAAFKVFDGTLYRHKPDLSGYGIEPIDILYAARFWPDTRSPRAMARLPDRARVRSVARAASAAGRPVVVDIEHWPLGGDDAAMRENLAKYITVLQWMRDAAPALNLGYFGRLPMTAYGWALAAPGSRDDRRWRAENERRGALAPFVDAVYPPLYTYSPNQHAWVRYAEANLREAHRYGKPVYAFLWPRYSEHNKDLGLQPLPADFWRLQLETVRKYADGVVIWGGWDAGRGGPADWDGSAPWWQETRRFMEELMHGSPPGGH